MPAFITLDQVSYRAPDGRTLIDNLTLAFGRERTGLVGRNGVGKTTFLRLILGEAEPTSGTLAVSGRVAVLRQALGPPVAATVAGFMGLTEPLARLARLEAGEGVDGDLEIADWTLPQRIEESMAEMGLAGVRLDSPAGSLSGGEATRAALAALLIAEPDVILLDEPTNNLDAAGRAAIFGAFGALEGRGAHGQPRPRSAAADGPHRRIDQSRRARLWRGLATSMPSARPRRRPRRRARSGRRRRA